MVALEPNKKLCDLLQQKYPQIRTFPHSLQQAEKILFKDFSHQPLLMVSSLPFASLLKSHKREIKTILDHILKNSPGSVLIQYTYKITNPLEVVEGDIRSKKEKTVLRNVPPPHIWGYCYSHRH
jgi:phospholipid N-methyltransferase